ncbi:MAG: F0F1 ATP synthase subunit B' [Alphaproteobacteria bacterium]|jgi:F-type H+-transporting ATPase subunit b|nr:F0F1 ATP synthase subunit B' [Alphaproteobacteria bacterium]
MPQFWMEDFAPQIVWLVISFIALYLLMARVALPRVANVLEARHGRIADDLDQAAQLKSQAETVISEYEAALVKARAEAQATIAQAGIEAASAAEKRNAEVADVLATEAAAAADRIATAKNDALAEMRGVAAELAKAAAERLIGADVPQADVDAAVDGAMTTNGGGS